MKVKDLSAFLQVCKNRGIRKAAETMYITPQGLSKLIQNLENRIGMPLFYRGSNGLHLTESGKIFKKYAESVLERTRKMETAIERQRGRRGKDVELVCSNGLLGAFLLDCVEELRGEHPDMDLRVTETTDNAVYRKVRDEEGAVGVAAAPPDPLSFEAQPLCSFRYALLVCRDNPLASKCQATVEDLRGQSLILFDEEYRCHHSILAECRAAGFQPRVAYTVSWVVMALRLCAMDNGVAVVCDFLAGDHLPKGVVAVPFTEPFCTWDVSMLTKKGAPLSDDAGFLWDKLMTTGSRRSAVRVDTGL